MPQARLWASGSCRRLGVKVTCTVPTLTSNHTHLTHPHTPHTHSPPSGCAAPTTPRAPACSGAAAARQAGGWGGGRAISARQGGADMLFRGNGTDRQPPGSRQAGNTAGLRTRAALAPRPPPAHPPVAPCQSLQSAPRPQARRFPPPHLERRPSRSRHPPRHLHHHLCRQQWRPVHHLHAVHTHTHTHAHAHVHMRAAFCWVIKRA